jgi:DNA invertase Pin-like site-specific DNA recombinase
MAKIGYGRVSRRDQDLTIQTNKLREAGCGRIFTEKKSGKSRLDRKELAKAVGALNPGDQLVVTAIDRASRSVPDLLHLIEEVQAKGATIKSLNDPWLDTSGPTGELVVTILAAVASWERKLIVARTSEGRAKAMERGVKFGRPSALTHYQQQQALQRIADGATQIDVARLLGVSAMCVSRLIRKSPPIRLR